MGDWTLSKPEYKVLLSYIGCGDIPNADIIVFGNEEGTGGYSVTANVKARVKYFGKKEKEDLDRFYCIENGQWEKGFFHPNSQDGGKLVERCLLPHESVRHQTYTAGVFNATVARLCLAYEKSGVNNWFEGSEKNKNAIKEYIGKELYKVRDIGIQTALVDWRPLPRDNETIWYPSEYGNVANSPEDKPSKDNPYLAVFDKPKSKYKPEKFSTSRFSDFKKDMEQRSELIKNAFIKSKAKIIIGIGGAAGFKKDALEIMFGENIFKSLELTVDMRNSKGQVQKAFHGVIPFENKSLNIFLIPFPEQGRGFPTQVNALAMLEELYDRYIKAILESSFKK